MAHPAKADWASSMHKVMPSSGSIISDRNLQVMECLVRDKFRRHPTLRDKLLSTNERPFVGRGQHSALIRALTSVRDEIKRNVDLELWLFRHPADLGGHR